MVLTGDIHQEFAFEVPHPNGSFTDVGGVQEGSVATEFTATSVVNDPRIWPVTEAAAQQIIPWLEHGDIDNTLEHRLLGPRLQRWSGCTWTSCIPGRIPMGAQHLANFCLPPLKCPPMRRFQKVSHSGFYRSSLCPWMLPCPAPLRNPSPWNSGWAGTLPAGGTQAPQMELASWAQMASLTGQPLDQPRSGFGSTPRASFSPTLTWPKCVGLTGAEGDLRHPLAPAHGWFLRAPKTAAPPAAGCAGVCDEDANQNGICDDIEDSLCGPGSVWSPSLGLCVGVSGDCPTDLDNNGSTGSADLLIFLTQFGTNCSN